jgi:hypothetical protein
LLPTFTTPAPTLVDLAAVPSPLKAPDTTVPVPNVATVRPISTIILPRFKPLVTEESIGCLNAANAADSALPENSVSKKSDKLPYF